MKYYKSAIGTIIRFNYNINKFEYCDKLFSKKWVTYYGSTAFLTKISEKEVFIELL